MVWRSCPKNARSFIIYKANIVIIIGTSLKVYPAADLINFVSENCKVYLIETELNIRKVTHQYGTKELDKLMMDY